MGRLLSEFVKRQLHSTMDRVGKNERRSQFNEHAIKMLAQKVDDLHDAIDLLQDRISKLIERLKVRFEEIEAISSRGSPEPDAATQECEAQSQS